MVQFSGAVGWEVYTYYVKAAGSAFVLSSLVAVIATTEGASILTNWLLRLWAGSFDRIAEGITVVLGSSSSVQIPLQIHDADAQTESDYYLRLYLIAACISLFLFGARVCECASVVSRC